jgi:2,3-bisphosphoglycerate-independent phosphoglycerate mutase
VKHIILVGDGMADDPQPVLSGKTPLEVAFTPNMDQIAERGRVGRALTIPPGLPPGSDVANLSLLGYDAAANYQGRGPIEAASIGVELGPDETAFRCNLVTLGDGLMADYSAGHITTDESRPILLELQAALGTDRVRFVPGISYRHLMIIRDFPEGLDCTPPHDISGREWAPHLPKGPGQDVILDLMEKARPVLAESEINRKRATEGKTPATDIWPWGQGRAMKLQTLGQRFGLKGSVISAVDLVRGLGILAGLKVRLVPGATGYLGTNYAGKIAAAKDALAGEDFVYLHPMKPAMRATSQRKSRPSRNSTGTSSAKSWPGPKTSPVSGFSSLPTTRPSSKRKPTPPTRFPTPSAARASPGTAGPHTVSGPRNLRPSIRPLKCSTVSFAVSGPDLIVFERKKAAAFERPKDVPALDKTSD